MTKKEILKSPVRKWNDTDRLYKRVLLVPTGMKHGSGYMRVAIVGVWVGKEKEKYETCGYPDDISTYFPMIKLSDGSEYPNVRMDCIYPSGILQYHGRGDFWVSEASSSMDIKFIPLLTN